MSKETSAAVGVFVVAMVVSGLGVVLVALALWAAAGWAAAVGFLGAVAIVIGWAILQVRG